MSDFLHATAVVIGEKAVLILGDSGSGKSVLAERLICEARGRGLFASLVGDDRVAIRAVAGRLIVSGHPRIPGQIERRGIGIFAVDFEQNAVLRGVISLVRESPRLPEEGTRSLDLAGATLPLLTLRDDQDLAAKAHLALEWIGA